MTYDYDIKYLSQSENVHNFKLASNGVIIGVIYRHDNSIKSFYEKPSEQLLPLNSRK